MHPKTSKGNFLLAMGAICFLAGLLMNQQVSAMSPYEQAETISALSAASNRQPFTLAVIENPELATRVLESLLRSIASASSNFDYQFR